MTSLAIILLILYMSLDTFGHLALKAAASHGQDVDFIRHWKIVFSRFWLWAGVICYVFEFFVWAAFLSQVPLAVGVMLGSFNTVVLMFAGRIMFKEQLTPKRIAGISLITLGVILVGWGA